MINNKEDTNIEEKRFKPKEPDFIQKADIKLIESIYVEYLDSLEDLTRICFNKEFITFEKHNYLRPTEDTEVYVHPDQSGVHPNTIRVIQNFEDRFFIQILSKQIVSPF